MGRYYNTGLKHWSVFYILNFSEEKNFAYFCSQIWHNLAVIAETCYKGRDVRDSSSPGQYDQAETAPGTWNLVPDSSPGRYRHFRPGEDLRTPFDLQETVKVSRLPALHF